MLLALSSHPQAGSMRHLTPFRPEDACLGEEYNVRSACQ